MNDDVIMTAGNVINDNNVQQGKTRTVVNRQRYKWNIKFVKHVLDETTHIESIRKHCKSNYSTAYLNMIEFADKISMSIRQMIVSERVNSAQT